MKQHVNLSLDEDIAITLKQLADENYTTMSQFVTDLILAYNRHRSNESNDGTLYRIHFGPAFLDASLADSDE